MKLGEIETLVPGSRVGGDSTVNLNGISLDSRTTEKGDLFVAIKGANVDARKFIPGAIARGAVAVASEDAVELQSFPTIQIPNLRKELGRLAGEVYGQPSRELSVVGITGTNGKTTTSHFVEAMLSGAGHSVGYVGTLSYRWENFETRALHTTPEASDLQKMMRQMRLQEVTHLVIECSSHGIEMGRLNGVAFDVALFTNLTQDHLDFHETMERYAQAKRKLFTQLLDQSPKPNRFAILNIDDPTGLAWSEEFTFPVITFSIENKKAHVHASDVELTSSGIRARITVAGRSLAFSSELVGSHNLSNFLAAFSVGHAFGLDLEKSVQTLQKFKGVPGRLERIENEKGVHVFVDYAHTDDALLNVLNALEPLRNQRLIVVFGCGGDRDRNKRPKMAGVASTKADVTIVTSDNPRAENPDAIIQEILPGLIPNSKRVDASALTRESRNEACEIVDRKAAIQKALEIAAPGDIVLIAGKGHETYQEVKGVQHPFDDRVVTREWFSKGLN